MSKKPRSPRYPSLSLQHAIEKVRAVYEKEYTHRVNKELVAKRMGYTSLNGASLTTISALCKYGLLGGRGELQVTPLAVTILADPPDSPERQAAIREAALLPTLFTTLSQHYGGRMPSVENVSAYLQKNNFTPRAATAAAHAYLDTMELVSPEAGGYNTPQEEAGNESSASPQFPDTWMADMSKGQQAPKTKPKQGDTPPQPPDQELLQQRVAKDCVAKVMFQGRATQQAVDKLVEYLKLMKDTLPSES